MFPCHVGVSAMELLLFFPIRLIWNESFTLKMKFQWMFAPLKSEFDALLKNKHLNGETSTTDQQKRVEIPVQWRYGYHFRCVPPVGTQQHPLSKMDRILFDFFFCLQQSREIRHSWPVRKEKSKVQQVLLRMRRLVESQRTSKNVADVIGDVK